jgi:hypothetical protein
MTNRSFAPYQFKVLGDKQTSCHGGDGRWVKNRWRTVTGALVPCRNGIHYCRQDQLVRWLGPQIWLFEDGTPDETLGASDKMVTRKGRVVERLDTWSEATARLFAADCAEAVLHLIPESHREPFTAAVAAARGFARGEISDEERVAAEAAARAAARAAAEAAAGAAAGAAAWAAAWAAAEAAARAAAGAAAWAAARADQTTILFAYLTGERQ